MNKARTTMPRHLGAVIVLLVVAGVAGWLVAGWLTPALGGTDSAEASQSAVLPVIGIVVVLGAGFFLAASIRKTLKYPAGLSAHEGSGSDRRWMAANGSFASSAVTSAPGRGLDDPAEMFLQRVASEVARATRYRSSLSLLLLALDGPGDPVRLRIVGEIIGNSVRASDTYGPTGEGYLAIVLVETDVSGARRVAEKLRRSVEVYPFDAESAVTVSIGLAGHSPGDDHQSLMTRCRDACASARESGGNRVSVS